MALLLLSVLLLALCASPLCCGAVNRLTAGRLRPLTPRARLRLVAAFSLLGLLLRAACAAAVPASLSPGEAALLVQGRRFLQDGLPVATAASGALPALLSHLFSLLCFGSVRALRLLPLLLSAATVPLAALCALPNREEESPLPVCVAAVFALCPFLIQSGAALRPLPFALFLLTAGACAGVRGRLTLAGALLGLACWTLPGAVVCALPLFAALLLMPAGRRTPAGHRMPTWRAALLFALLALLPACCFLGAALYLPGRRVLGFTLPELSLPGVEAAWLQGLDALRPTLIARVDALLSFEVFRFFSDTPAEGALLPGMGRALIAFVPVTLAGVFACLRRPGAVRLPGVGRALLLWAALTAAGICLLGIPGEDHLLLLSLPLLFVCAAGVRRLAGRMPAAGAALLLLGAVACGQFLAGWLGAENAALLQRTHLPGMTEALCAAAETGAEQIVVADCFDLWDSSEDAAKSLVEAALGRPEERLTVEYLDAESLRPEALEKRTAYVLTAEQAGALGIEPAARFGGFAVVSPR